MKSFGKRCFALALILGMVFPAASALAAEPDDQKRLDSVRSEIRQDFENDKTRIDRYNKPIYGLSDSESFSAAVLGDGYTYYTISTDSLEKDQSGEDALKLGGYIFPMIVSNREVGLYIVRAKNSSEIAMTSDHQKSILITTNKIVRDVESAKKLIGDPSSSKLIYDNDFHIYSLAVPGETGYDLVPIRDSEGFGLVKNQKTSLESIEGQLQEELFFRKNNPMMLGGSGGMGDPNAYQSRPVYYLAGFLCFLLITAVPVAVTRALQKKQSSFK